MAGPGAVLAVVAQPLAVLAFVAGPGAVLAVLAGPVTVLAFVAGPRAVLAILAGPVTVLAFVARSVAAGLRAAAGVAAALGGLRARLVGGAALLGRVVEPRPDRRPVSAASR
jgi:hypothetical protein